MQPCYGRRSVSLAAPKIEKPQLRELGLFLRFLCSTHHKWNRSLMARSAHGSLSVNQVERAFIPLRSMLLPSHTANAIGTDMPALNCVSLASPVSRVRFTTMRQVGPEYPPPLTEPAGSHTPLPMTS